MPANLARVGVTIFALLFAIAMATERPAAARGLAPAASRVRIASAAPAAAPDLFLPDGPTVGAGFQFVPLPDAEPPDASLFASAEAPAPPAVQLPAVSAEAIILASWYGPGFYGNRTACGQLYTPEIIGVAHKTLPCGTLLILRSGSRVVTVPVIDRGPYVAGRTVDLSNGTRLALGCADLCTLRMQVLR